MLRTALGGRLSARAQRAARRARRATTLETPARRPLGGGENGVQRARVDDAEFVGTVVAVGEEGGDGDGDGGGGVGRQVECECECEEGVKADVAAVAMRGAERKVGDCADMTVRYRGSDRVKDGKEVIKSAGEDAQERDAMLVNLTNGDCGVGRRSRVFAMPGYCARHGALQQKRTIFLWNDCSNRVEPKQVTSSQVPGQLAAHSHLSLYVGQDDPMFLQKMEGKMVAPEDAKRWALDMAKPGLQRRVMIFYAFQLVLMPFLESPLVCSLEMYMRRAEQRQARQFAVFAGALTCTDGLACNCGTYVKQILE